MSHSNLFCFFRIFLRFAGRRSFLSLCMYCKHIVIRARTRTFESNSNGTCSSSKSLFILSMETMISNFRLVELLLSVNGDTRNTDGLKATKGVTDGLSVVLSLSATAYLEPWQTLYLMIRSTGVGAFEVVDGSTFSVALIGKQGEKKNFIRCLFMEP